jgi:hypothetical protein
LVAAFRPQSPFLQPFQLLANETEVGSVAATGGQTCRCCSPFGNAVTFALDQGNSHSSAPASTRAARVLEEVMPLWSLTWGTMIRLGGYRKIVMVRWAVATVLSDT